MAAIVYLLCAATCLACTILLLRAYKHSRVRLLFWSGLCFFGLAINNALLFIDLELYPQANLFMVRSMPALAGLLALIYGLIWDREKTS